MTIDLTQIEHTQADRLPSVDGRALLGALREEYSPMEVKNLRDYLKDHRGDYNGRVGEFYDRVVASQKEGGSLSGADQHYLLQLMHIRNH